MFGTVELQVSQNNIEASDFDWFRSRHLVNHSVLPRTTDGARHDPGEKKHQHMLELIIKLDV